MRPPGSDAGAVAAVAFFVFVFLDVRQIGFDSAVVVARVNVGVNLADEPQSGVAVDAVQVNSAAWRKFGDGRVYLSADAPKRRASGQLVDIDLAINMPNIHAAFDFPDGHVAVDVVGYERDFAGQLQHYALAAFRDRAERREDAAPVIIDADAKLAR